MITRWALSGRFRRRRLVAEQEMVHTIGMGASTLGHYVTVIGSRWPVREQRSLRHWYTVFLVRAGAFSALGVAALSLPAVGHDRFRIGMLLLLLAAPYNLALLVDLRRNHRIHPSTVFLDVIGASLFHLWFEGMWTSVLVVALASVALAAVGFGRRITILLTAVATASFTFAAAMNDTPNAIVGVLTFLIAAGMVVLTVGIVADSERQARQHFTRLVEGIDGVVWELDRSEFTLTYVSSRAESMFGYSTDELYIPGFLRSCIHPDDLDVILEGDTVPEVRTVPAEFRVVHKDGRVVWVRNFMRDPSFHGDQKEVLRGVLVDISAQKAGEQLIAQYSDIVANMQVGLLVWQLVDGELGDPLRLVAGNRAAWELMDGAGEALIGSSFVEVFPELSDAGIASRVAEVIRGEDPGVLDQVEYLNRAGERLAMFVRVFALPNRCAGFAFEDVTGQMHLEEALRHQALHDHLTALPNRALFNERLGWVLAEASRRATSVALLLLDLNQFKEVNDTLGHFVGDELLRQVAQRLRLLLRESDTIARIGGDEFAILLTTAADETASREVATKISAAFAEPFRIDSVELNAGASIGIALFPGHAGSADELLQCADHAMYAAKRSGSGFAVYVSEDDRTGLDRIQLLGEMYRAVEHDELVVHYLPKISIETGQVVDVEALVRWRHPQQGLLGPLSFIELAELSGAVQPLARQVIAKGLEQCSLWSKLELGVGLAVNLSVRNLYDPTLATFLADEINRFSLDPSDVLVEVAEKDLMDDPTQVTGALTRLSDLGIRLAIDDFGTGSSSLTSLRDFPVGELKIDRSFITTILYDPNSETIVRSMIDLGHNLGFTVVAEGVENLAVLDHLKNLGCDHAQGFQISRPLTADELMEWFERRGGSNRWPKVGV